MNDYEQRQQEKAEYYAEKARQAQKASSAAYESSSRLAGIIPFGQPILIGHHSEGRHRRDIERIHNAMDRSVQERDKAEYYATKAANAANPSFISSDNPDAVKLLKEKLVELEAEHLRLKALPKDKREWYALPYSSAGIKRIKKRIDELEAKATMPDIDKEINGVRMVSDKEFNRLRLYFPSIPSEEVRATLKYNGFKWSPNAGAWQRQLNNTAVFTAEYVLNGLAPPAPSEVKA